MYRKIDLTQWSDKAKKKIKLLGQELYLAKYDDFVPEDQLKLGWIHFSKSKDEADKVIAPK